MTELNVKELQANVEQIVTDLETLLEAGEVPERDREFVESLVNGKWGYRKRGYLSDKQVVWASKKLAAAIAGPYVAPTEQVAELSGLIDFINHAKQHMKYPKIRATVDGNPFMLALAGDKSKKPGWVNITDGGPYGSNNWYGRISPEGEWEQPASLDEGIKKLLRRMMTDFAKDAKSAATKYGKMTGNCCFCNKSIGEGENEISVAMGYGPSCAKKWGLPWGVTAMKEKAV